MSHGEFFNKARWIWSGQTITDAWWMFRTTVVLPMDCREACLRITAAHHYILYVNGVLVTRGPAVSFDFSKAFDTADIQDYLRPGKINTVAVLAPEHLKTEYCALLAELSWLNGEGVLQVIGTDDSWKVRRHDAFLAGTAGHSTGRGLLLGREEWFDARNESNDWPRTEFDDSAWAKAQELGPAIMSPWTQLAASGIGLLSDDPVLPRSIVAIELARLRPGHRIRLISPHQHLDAIKVYATEVSCTESATILLRTAKSPFGPTDVYLDGKGVPEGEFVLSAGRHLLCVCQRGYFTYESEFLLETAQALHFSAEAFVGGRKEAWVVCAFPAGAVNFPWHESPSTIADPAELQELLRVASVSAMPPAIRAKFQVAAVRPGSVSFDVTSQYVYKVRGGHGDIMLYNGQSRLPADPALASPVVSAQNLLHGHPDATTVLPTPGRDAHLILDFDIETIGYVEMTLDAPAGTVVDVQCFEMIPWGIAWMPHNGFRYVCREGRQTFTSHIRRGFRYLSLTLRGFDRPVKIYHLQCRHNSFPVQEVGSFTCSDIRLNQAYRMSLDTAALCMLDSYVDCPGHEQTFWVGDARITALINQINFGAFDLDQRCIRLVGQSLSPEWVAQQRPDDERYTSGRFLPMAAFPNYPEGGLPMWPLLWVTQCWDHWMHGGDRDDLEENYGYVADMMRRCQLLTNERGLLDIPGAWNLIEWGANDLSPYGEVTANNVLLVHGLRLVSQMARALGLEKESLAHTADAEARTVAINRYCWSEERQAYVDSVRDEWAYQRYCEVCATRGWQVLPLTEYMACLRISEQTNTLAVLSGCVSPERLEKIKPIIKRVGEGHFKPSSPAARLPRPPTEEEAPGGIVAIGSPFFVFFSLGMLFQIGEPRMALDIMQREWGKMAASGLRTCSENFGATRSTAHAWSAAPAAYLPLQVLGVRPIEPGFRSFIVEPCANDLAWARGSVFTPYGPIQVHWRRLENGELDVTCSAPEECRRVFIDQPQQAN